MHKRMKVKSKLEAYMMREAGECIDTWRTDAQEKVGKWLEAEGWVGDWPDEHL